MVPFILIIVALIVAILILLGRPIALRYKIRPFLDSFETTDFETFGRRLTPYVSWDLGTDEQIIEIILWVEYRFPRFLLNWQRIKDLELILEMKGGEQKVPNGFDVYLQTDSGSVNRYSHGHSLSLSLGGKADHSEVVRVVVRRRSPLSVVENPSYFVLRIIAATVLGVCTSVPVEFHVGPGLGNLWVGLDPGTTGSCIAAGSAMSNLLMQSDADGNPLITPSKLVFKKDEINRDNSADLKEGLHYEVGDKAEAFFGNSNVVSFQSIKKILGFKNPKEIRGTNGVVLHLNATDLTDRIVRHIYSSFESFVVEKGLVPEFNPHRVVIAIPNNFTASKIKALLECDLVKKQFKEVRFIHEAEAVLFDCIRSGKIAKLLSQNVLIFDMGGGSVNVTLLNLVQHQGEYGSTQYHLNILSKFSYAIGGDTIDYCLSKFFYEKWLRTTEVGKLADPFEKTLSGNAIQRETQSNLRIHFVNIAQLLKLQLVDRFKDSERTLVSARDLTKRFNDGLEDYRGANSITCSEKDAFVSVFAKDGGGMYPILSDSLLKENVFSYVEDAVRGALQIGGFDVANEATVNSSLLTLHYVIFSGRSSAFPLVKEKVWGIVNDLGRVGNNEPLTLTSADSKAAVARGACWYGINRGTIKRSVSRTSCAFGVKRSLSGNVNDIEFIPIIEIGTEFEKGEEGRGTILRIKSVDYDFANDNNTVRFYQVMGKDATEILRNNDTPKFHLLAEITAKHVVRELGMMVDENDNIRCGIGMEAGVKPELRNSVLGELEITDTTAEHYGWILQ